MYFYVKFRHLAHYSETCLKQPLKHNKSKVLKTGGSLVQVKSIAECSGAFCNSFDLHYVIIGLENIFLSDHLRQVLLYKMAVPKHTGPASFGVILEEYLF